MNHQSGLCRDVHLASWSTRVLHYNIMSYGHRRCGTCPSSRVRDVTIHAAVGPIVRDCTSCLCRGEVAAASAQLLESMLCPVADHSGCMTGAGHNRAALSSQSLRSVARGSMGLNPADPLLRQNEEVLQVRQPTPCFHLFGVNAHPLASF